MAFDPEKNILEEFPFEIQKNIPYFSYFIRLSSFFRFEI